jgi:hypothetical protein
VTKVGFTVMMQNKATVIAVEEPTITKSKKGMAGAEVNKEHAHWLYFFCLV